MNGLEADYDILLRHFLLYQTSLTDYANRDSLLHDKPDVDDSYSRPWSVNILMTYYKGRT